VLYIGRATVLRSRVASYWPAPRGREHLVPMVARVARIEAVACESVHEATWLERNLLTAALPPWNKTPGGQEVPVCIVLDSRAASPRLTVWHVPVPEPPTAVECFGPYLGGRRVRLAVRGLHRGMPLPYTGTSLRGAERDIARARGVTAADRHGFASAIRAALRREPHAVAQVRSRLVDLREEAARVLAFELAAQVNEEIKALEWVTCPQRATSLDQADFTACGWSAGVLTSLVVRGGQITEWTQRPCGEASAAPLLAATPPAWADFAQRNADLAAALSHAERLARCRSRCGRSSRRPRPAAGTARRAAVRNGEPGSTRRRPRALQPRPPGQWTAAARRTRTGSATPAS
jgi:excinuclease ABC subunit C